MKTLILTTLAVFVSFASAKDKAQEKKPPSGYISISEWPAAIDKADGKKLIMLVVKGADDACPNCATALANGESAVGSGVVKVFARSESIMNVPADHFSEELKNRINKHFTRGAAVTIVMLSPDGEKLLAESDRSELQSDKKAIKAFKDKVKELKAEYK